MCCVKTRRCLRYQKIWDLKILMIKKNGRCRFFLPQQELEIIACNICKLQKMFLRPKKLFIAQISFMRQKTKYFENPNKLTLVNACSVDSHSILAGRHKILYLSCHFWDSWLKNTVEILPIMGRSCFFHKKII